MIRSVKVTTQYSNKNKQELIHKHIKEYSVVVQAIIKDIWDNGYKNTKKTNSKSANLKKEYNKEKISNPIKEFNLPKQNNFKHNKKERILYTYFNPTLQQFDLDANLNNTYLKQFNTSNFTQRMMQACGTQASSIIRSCTTKAKRTKFILDMLREENKNSINDKQIKKLQSKLDIMKISCPKFETIYPQLDSRFFDIEETKKERKNLNNKKINKDLDNNNINKESKYDCFIKLRLFENESINIPYNKYKLYNELESKGKLLNSIRLHYKDISFSFELPDLEKKKEGIKLGADQGIKTCLSLSDNQVTIKNKHGYDLDKIIKIISRKQKGSKNFHQIQEHRKNYINWSVNQLNFDNVKTINLEKLYNMRRGKKSNRYLSAFTYTLIKKKLESVSENKGFMIMEIDNIFRSQRCSNCGWTQKSNRLGKVFKCKSCGFTTDSDLNAAYNLEDDNLFVIPEKVRLEQINRKGFFWNKHGVFKDAMLLERIC